MVRPTDQGTMAIEKIVCYSRFSREGMCHGQGSPGAQQATEGVEGWDVGHSLCPGFRRKEPMGQAKEG